MGWLQENWLLALAIAGLSFQAIRLVFWWRWLNRDRQAFERRMEAMQRRARGLRDIRESKP